MNYKIYYNKKYGYININKYVSNNMCYNILHKKINLSCVLLIS